MRGSITEVILHDKPQDDRPTIGSLEYNTPVTGVPSGSDNVYIKMKKDRTKHAWTKGHCLILNTKYGTTREIPGETLVTPCRGVMNFHPLSPDKYHTALK